MKTTEKIFDALTGKTTIIERDMTAEEIAEAERIEALAAEEVTKKAEAAAKRQALLDRLGITEEEAKLLLG